MVIGAVGESGLPRAEPRLNGTAPVFSASWTPGIEKQRLVVHGELDLATSQILGEALRATSGIVEIECSSLGFIDAAAIGVLLRARDHVESIRIVHASPWIRKVFAILDLEEMFFDGQAA